MIDARLTIRPMRYRWRQGYAVSGRVDGRVVRVFVRSRETAEVVCAIYRTETNFLLRCLRLAALIMSEAKR